MSISAPFIRRPVATSLIAAACFLVGIVAYFMLPVAALPQVDFPTIQVNGNLPGASPETMASNVATPLERQFSVIPGITQMTSSSTLGSTSVTLQFELSRNIDAAAQDVQAAISAAGGQLPNNLPSPPTIRKVNPADAPIVGFALQSKTLPISVVSDYGDNVLGQRLSRIDGVGLVNIVGQRKPAIRIRIDPRKAAAMGIQLDTVRTAIANATVNAPKGQLTGDLTSATVYANDQLTDARGWNDLIVGYKAGAAVRIRDLGGAVADVENVFAGAYALAGKSKYADKDVTEGPTVIVLVVKQPGANVIQTAEAIKKAIPQIQASLPPGITMTLIEDKTQTIRASVEDVQYTLLITIVLVVAVIFVFLRDVRATILPSIVIPLALLATCAVMLFAKFSLDNLSLMALTIAVGFVVDDAIVMVEAIWRRIEEGESPLHAALEGSKEISFTVLSISISLVAVFTPLMFMGGVVGRLMREFALTLSAAVAMSVLLTLTVTPMMCALFLKKPKPARSRILLALEHGFTRMENAYARTLDVVMRHMGITFGVFIGTTLLAVIMYATASTGFFPQQDTGFLQGSIITADSSSYAYTTGKAKQIVRIIATDPDVTEVHYGIGGNTSQGNINATLSLREQGRKATADQIIARLRPKLAQVVGANTFLQASQDINVGGRASRAQYQYTLSDSDIDELNAWTPRLVAALQKVPELKDVSSDQQSTAPSATLVIDRDAAGRFGITPSDIDAAVYNQIGQRQVAQFFTQVNSYRVIMEAPAALQSSPDLFNSIYINSPRTGRPVPLSVVAHVDTSKTRSLSVAHQGQAPAATISFNLAPGAALGTAVKAVEKVRGELGAPPSLEGSFQGTAAAFQQSLSTLPVLIVAALLTVYIVLGVLYESYKHPLTILSTLPSAGVGALLALKVVGMDLNVIGIIAIILLIGIVKKNGIMIVDVALKLQRDQGMSAVDAVVAASHQRLRPILMTTACAFFSGVPMIFGSGTGSEFRQPLGWAIVGGLLVSQILTLYTTPVTYVLLDRLGTKRRRPGTQLPPDASRPAHAAV